MADTTHEPGESRDPLPSGVPDSQSAKSAGQRRNAGNVVESVAPGSSSTAGADDDDEPDAPSLTTGERRDWRIWINQATISGALNVGVALALLVTPELTASALRILLGSLLMVAGGVSLFRQLRHRDGHAMAYLGLAESSVALLIGVAMLAFPIGTLEAVAVAVGILLVVDGAVAGVRALRGRGGQRVVDGVRAAAMLSLSIFAFTMPASVISSAIIAIATLGLLIGGLMIAHGAQAAAEGRRPDFNVAMLTYILVDWVEDWDIGKERREAIRDKLYMEAPHRVSKLIAWWVMLLLSVAIATFAVLQDSTAVVIGAMLIAPLMTPILGAAAAVVNGHRHRVASSLLLVAAGVAVSVLLSYIIATWIPTLVPLDVNSQVTSRVNPNVIDMGIALAAGAAGAFAMVNRRVADSIAGVAIAVALVPPLSVVGVTLQAGRWEDATGSFLLFVTNLVAILLSAVATFVLTGYISGRRLAENRQQILTTMGVVAGVAAVILVPLVFTAQGILAVASAQSTAHRVASDWLAGSDQLTLDRVLVEPDNITVDVSGSQRLPDAEALGDEMSEELGRPVTVTVHFTPATVTVYDQGEIRQEGIPLLSLDELQATTD